MSTPASPHGYEPWAVHDRRLSAEAGIDPDPDADLTALSPEHCARWLRATCLDFADVAGSPDSPLALRRAAADRVRGIAAHFLAVTGGDYTTEGK